MRPELFDYQTDAVDEVLARLQAARQAREAMGWNTSFALTAVTGAGKTVIAAAVIEAILRGSEPFGVEPDPAAVFLWVSKDPSLNVQTRKRFIADADQLDSGDLILLDKDYPEDRLMRGKVYFINPAKLSKKALFVRRDENSGREYTFWDLLARTIADPDTTLYVVQDEAHEGMKASTKDDLSIVLRIINGQKGLNPPAPIVWGISATPQRFKDAMEGATARTPLPDGDVVIDPVRVQESGLIKTSLAATIPDEKGEFGTTFVRNAAVEFDQVCKRWDDYTTMEGIEPVTPLLILQIPNRKRTATAEKAEDELILTHVDIIRDAWPGFTDDCVAHVLGDRETIKAGTYVIPKVAAEDVQDNTDIRVLVAKDAISTGWDCPRAEVLVSLRPGEEHQYITQLLGRMVRNPLLPPPTDDRLNSASAFLARFNVTQVETVVDELLGKRPIPGSSGGQPSVRKVLIDPVDIVWNESLPDGIRDLIENLPSFPKPADVPKPITRLFAAAVDFAGDNLVPKANEDALNALMNVLDGLVAQHASLVDKVVADIKTASLKNLTAHLRDGSIEATSGEAEADAATVHEALKSARGLLGAKLVNEYVRRRVLALKAYTPDDITDEQAKVAALALIDLSPFGTTVLKEVEDAADTLYRSWWNAHKATIRTLPDARRREYERLNQQARSPENIPTAIPDGDRASTKTVDLTPLPTAKLHVLADPQGAWPVESSLNAWERRVLRVELGEDYSGDPDKGATPGTVAWYRNPSSATGASLRIAYKSNRQDKKWKSLQPDFIFVNEIGGKHLPTILDPHGAWLPDAKAKLLALAEYALNNGDAFYRIESLASLDKTDKLLSIDLLDGDTRDAVLAAADTDSTAEDLFNALGTPYGG